MNMENRIVVCLCRNFDDDYAQANSIMEVFSDFINEKADKWEEVNPEIADAIRGCSLK